MLLGYVHTNIWRLYDMETRRITEASNVIFNEEENAWKRWSDHGHDDYLESPFDDIESEVFPSHLDGGSALNTEAENIADVKEEPDECESSSSTSKLPRDTYKMPYLNTPP